MKYEIRPVINERGIKYRVDRIQYHQGVFGTKTLVDTLQGRAISEYEVRYDFYGPGRRFYGAFALFDTPQEAAKKIRELYGTTAYIATVEL